MRVGYLDCFSGISGDMCLGALVDAGVPLQKIQDALSTLPMSGYSLTAERVLRGGIAATRVHVALDSAQGHPHRGLSDVLSIVEAGSLPPQVVQQSAAVFQCLAEAEARVHGMDVQSVHFHEVGAVDAICDIVGTAVGVHELGLESVRFSTVMLGGGVARSAHGMLPVPAPATAELLKGLPTAGGPVDVELTTPTGAAILKALGEPCPHWPPMSVERLGYGAGARDIPQLPNVLRLAVGSVDEKQGTESDCVWVLEANLDDMTGQEVGYCTGKLMAAGALDVFVTPVQMKKDRPGVQITVLCEPHCLEAMEAVLWRHSSTLGVRRSLWQRSKLRREARRVSTPWGEVRLKVAYLGEEAVRWEPEYEDCKAIADASGVPLRQVRQAAIAAIEKPEG
jgi:hypothetical protein